MKSFIVVLDGLSDQSLRQSCDWLNEVARLGCVGQLAVRACAANDEFSGVRLVSELLGVFDVFFEANGAPKSITRDLHSSNPLQADSGVPSFTDRYRKMTSALVSNRLDVAQMCSAQQMDATHIALSDSDPQQFENVMDRWEGILLQKLAQNELVILHVDCALSGPAAACDRAGDEQTSSVARFIDCLCRRIVPDLTADILCVAVSGRSHDCREPYNASLGQTGAARFRPTQSFTQSQSQYVQGISIDSPLVVAYHHPVHTRRDETAAFTLEASLLHGCNGMMLVDHFMHEIAFKLGRAPKYGA